MNCLAVQVLRREADRKVPRHRVEDSKAPCHRVEDSKVPCHRVARSERKRWAWEVWQTFLAIHHALRNSERATLATLGACHPRHWNTVTNACIRISIASSDRES